MAKVFDIGSGQDVESAREARAIAEREEFSTVILNASMDGILAYDTKARYTLWNPSMERMTGMKRQDVIGKCAFDLFPFLKEVGLDHQYTASLRGESIRSPVTRYVIPETGNHGYSEQQNFPLFDESGRITGGIAVIRDVTLIKERFEELAGQKRKLEARVQELEAQLRAKGG